MLPIFLLFTAFFTTVGLVAPAATLGVTIAMALVAAFTVFIWLKADAASGELFAVLGAYLFFLCAMYVGAEFSPSRNSCDIGDGDAASELKESICE